MLRAICLLNFVLTGLTGYFYQSLPQLAPGINVHGLIGVLGFGYTAFLHFLITPPRYGNWSRPLRSLLALTTLVLCGGALLNQTWLLNGAGVGGLGLSIVLVWQYRRGPAGWGVHHREDLFLQTATVISLLSWLYFLYSLNFTTFWLLECPFSHILLAFSFPLSLLLFARYVNLLRLSDQRLAQTVTVLVGGVLLLFAGLLTQLGWLKTVSGGALLLLIFLYLYRALKLRNPALSVAFGGLLLTGLSGIWYVLAEHWQHAHLILVYHAHLAHFAWGVYGIFYLLLLDAGFSPRRQLLFLTPLLLALLMLLPGMIYQTPGLLIAVLMLFWASGLCLPLVLFRKR
ncbi:MAG: hypothetical protein U5J62_01815 [Desulfurivibrio sp.]|nr:hypothetical protein [Desulfurivibrio sp.]